MTASSARTESVKCEFTVATDVPALEPGTIHVWLLELDGSYCSVVRDWLSREELERGAAFHFPSHRNEFIISRGVLRFLLGRYVDAVPTSLDIGTRESGKPYLTNTAVNDVRFNLAHSGEYAIFAFCIGEEIGIDIERNQASMIDEGLIEQCRATPEKWAFDLAQPFDKVPFFFDLWARKEAYLKLIGDGLSISPNQISLSSLDSECEIIGDEGIRFVNMPASEGYSAALATKHRPREVLFYKLGRDLLK